MPSVPTRAPRRRLTILCRSSPTALATAPRSAPARMSSAMRRVCCRAAGPPTSSTRTSSPSVATSPSVAVGRQLRAARPSIPLPPARGEPDLPAPGELFRIQGSQKGGGGAMIGERARTSCSGEKAARRQRLVRLLPHRARSVARLHRWPSKRPPAGMIGIAWRPSDRRVAAASTAKAPLALAPWVPTPKLPQHGNGGASAQGVERSRAAVAWSASPRWRSALRGGATRAPRRGLRDRRRRASCWKPQG